MPWYWWAAVGWGAFAVLFAWAYSRLPKDTPSPKGG